MHIPFNKPTVVGNELEYIQQAIAAGHLSGDGIFTKQCHARLEEITGCKKALLTTSCTHALELSALLLDIQPGDEVIVPSFTFVSTVNAFRLRGAIPVFIDCRPDTLNMDERLLEGLITNRTKAIVPVHYAGVGCEMDAIMEVANRYQIPVVEDNAHGLFGTYRGKALGSFGELAAQSFHETKNISCGEGGAILINDDRFIERAEIIREKGTDRSKFFRGEIDKYSWVDLGSSYLPSEINAAFLFAQLEQYPEIQTQRKHIWDFYYHNLQAWAERNGVTLPTVPAHCGQAYHMFYMLMPTADKRRDFIASLKIEGIHSVFHYLPLHLSKVGQAYGGKVGDCPVTEDVSERLVRLPMFFGLTDEEIHRICSVVISQ